MSKSLAIALVALATIASAPAGNAADMNKTEGKWSTWGCNVAWFDLGKDNISYYSTEQKLPNDLVSTHDAKIAENGNKLDVDYKWLGSDYKYIYDVKGKDSMLLDKLLVDGNNVFDRTLSGSPYKDRATTRCSPSA